ncbi:MAG: fimbria/pilus periplasmic chaperone [Bdellovibrionia bacterium]
MKASFASLLLLSLGLATSAVLFSTSSWAFRFSPMVSTLSPIGPEATQTFLVENNNGEKIALQIETFHREVDTYGKETRRETDEFSVFPQQMVLEPGEKRNIRLTWTGDRQIKEELAYRLVVSQLPVDLKKPEQRKAGANITFLLQYVASVYVSPGAAAPKISVESLRRLSDTKAELVLQNSGTAHKVLKGMHLYLKPEEGSSQKSRPELTALKLKDIEAENVLPGRKRRFEIPVAKDVALPATAQKLEVEFDSQ